MPDLEAVGALSPDRPLLKGHKTLPRRRQPEPELDQLVGTSIDIKGDNVNDVDVPVTPTLPLTPPNQIQDDPHRDGSPQLNGQQSLPLNHSMATLTTGSHQFTPPTPEVTPPRIRDTTPKARPVFASLQSSMSSRADSFQTAREHLSDDDLVENFYPSAHELVLRKRQKSFPEPSPLSNGFESIDDATDGESPKSLTENDSKVTNLVNGNQDGKRRPAVLTPSPLPKSPIRDVQDQTERPGMKHESANVTPTQRKRQLRSKRDPQFEVLDKSDENSAPELTDGEQKLMDRVNTWRFSGGSFTSTIEAMVIETPLPKQRTLRHIEKKTSLRSVSSPQPQSNRTSAESNADSPRRLVHKSARISNQNRHSVASDMSIPISTTSTYHPQRAEVIPVAIVPERRSSLKGSAPNSRNQSTARSATSSRRNNSISHSRASDQLSRRKKRTMSESAGSAVGQDESENRGRAVNGPVIPARSSSLSAPTSRNNSRATSLTSESLRRHTEAMQLAMSNQRGNNPTTGVLPSPRIVLPDSSDSRDAESLMPAPHIQDDMELLHAPSLHFTQPSVVSSSPGPVEIREATMVTYFPHNNESLLVINSYMQPELSTVKALHGHTLAEPVAVWTPQQSMAVIDVESPLRNPRTPPVPPVQRVVPQDPADQVIDNSARPELSRQGSSRISRGFGSVRRALSARRNSDIARQQPLSRSLSTRSANNRRAEKARDSQLYSFWRPRGFWDDFDSSPGNGASPPIQSGQQKPAQDEYVSNSLGLSQKRVIFSGPLVLARRISKSRKARRRNAERRHHQYSQSDLNLAMGMVRPHSPYQRRTIKFRVQKGILFPVRMYRNARRRAKESRQLRASAKLEARREKLKQSIGAKTLTDPYSVGPFNHGAPYEESDTATTRLSRGLY